MAAEFSNIKAIAFDLDLTVIPAGGDLSERTKQAFKAAAEKGLVFIPASGRPYIAIPDSIRNLPNAPYCITSNGAAVVDQKTGEPAQSWPMVATDVRHIMRAVSTYFLEGQITYECFVKGIGYASADLLQYPEQFRIPVTAARYMRETRRPERYMVDFIYEHAKEMDALDLILKDPGLYRMIETAVKRTAPDVYITHNVPYRMEISSKESGKDTGILWAAKQLGISPEEILAFGDADNDVGMLQNAGIGVALKNAAAECREAADYVTDLTCEEDGAAAFIEEHLL